MNISTMERKQEIQQAAANMKEEPSEQGADDGIKAKSIIRIIFMNNGIILEERTMVNLKCCIVMMFKKGP